MTFKERCDKIKKAATQFWNENKSLIIAAGGFIAGTFITYKIMKSDDDENEDENEEENKIDEIRIKVPSNNKGLVELARHFSDFCNSGDIEIYSF